eukprot:jgi/Bigna1/67354/fgenesh1_pg.3_\
MEEASPVRARLAIILVSLAVLSLLRTAENYPGHQGGKRNLLLSPLKERSVSRTSTYPRDLTAARLTRTRGLRNVGEVTLWGGGGAGSKPENASRGDDRLNTSDSNNLPPPLCVLKVVQGSLIAHQVLVARGIFGLEDAVHVTYTKSSFSRDFERGDGSGAIVLSHATNGSVITKNAMEAIAYMQKNLSHAAYVNVDLYHENDEAMKQRCEKLGAWLESDFSEAMINCARARVRRHPSTYKQFLDSVFGALERIEHLLTYQPWISGRNVTLADVQLFPMLVRLDHIFHALGVNRNYAMHMPSTNSYMRTIYQIQGVAEAMPMQQIRDYYFNSQMLNPGGFHSQGPEFDLDTAMPRRDDIGIAGFYKKVYPVAEEPGLSLQVQQITSIWGGGWMLGAKFCRLAFARDLRHLGMYDSSLKGQSLRLRKLAVKTLRVDTDLFLTDEEYISTRDMVECAAEQFNCTGDGYLTDMLRHTTWGGAHSEEMRTPLKTRNSSIGQCAASSDPRLRACVFTRQQDIVFRIMREVRVSDVR